MSAASPSNARPSLLVFTLGAARERERRRLLPSPLSAAEVTLHAGCLTSALAAGRAAGCRLTVSSPSAPPVPSDVRTLPQRGHGFGERLANAVAAASDGEPLLVVGTDVPDLTADHLRTALRRLARDPEQVVLGPSPDGGIYLLASTRPLAELLRGVRWCRSETLTCLRRALETAGLRVSLLEPLGDLDRPRDLQLWLARRRHALSPFLAPLVRSLHRALAALTRPTPRPVLGRPRPVLVEVRSGRAPPYCR